MSDDPAPKENGPNGAAPLSGDAARVIRRKEFIDLVVARAGGQRNAARTAVEATLAVLAEAVARGDDLVLPPLGRLRVMRDGAGRTGDQRILRLSPVRPAETAAAPLADPKD